MPSKFIFSKRSITVFLNKKYSHILLNLSRIKKYPRGHKNIRFVLIRTFVSCVKGRCTYGWREVMRDLHCPFFKTEKKCLNLEKWYHRNKALKKIVLKSVGCLVVYNDFFIVKTIVESVYYVFSGQFVTDKVINQYN